ncbi:MAG TPA: glycosyltransferase family 4 protein [Vicinamibacterales bacterium]
MHIVFLSVSSELGGSETVLLELVRGLRRLQRDWRLTAIVPREGPFSFRLRAAGADVRVLAIPAPLLRLGESARATALSRGAALIGAARSVRGYTSRLAMLLNELAPDVIHSNGLKPHVLAARARGPAAPLVWHIHEYVGARPMSRRLLRLHQRAAAIAVANSRSVAADLARALRPGLDIRTISNAVDLATFSPDGPTIDLDALGGAAPPARGVIRVGLVATFGRWKGHDVFLRALARLASPRPVRAYVIGGPVYDTAGSQYTLDELRTLARALGVADRMVFTGVIDPIAPALRGLDVVVHASTQPEPFGMVIAEAMACGRTVIVSAAGGAGEIVRPDEDALVHAPGDAEGLSSALARAVDDDALRARIGRAARQSAVARFDAARFAREFEALYQSLARSASAPVEAIAGGAAAG